MRRVALAFAAIGVGAGIWSSLGFRDPGVQIVVTGDLHGYLSPCGCSSPMVGGIRRRATAIQAVSGTRIVLDNGGFVKDALPQSQFKAETAAEAIAASGVSAINLAASDTVLGKGAILSISQLSEGKLLSTHLPEGNPLDVPRWIEAGEFLVGGITADSDALGRSLETEVSTPVQAARDLAEEASRRSKKAILMVNGPRSLATQVIADVSGLVLVVYSESGDPPEHLQTEGQTALVTAGDRGRNVVSMTYDGSVGNYRVVKLGPEVADDEAVSTIFRTYLQRVDDANFLLQWPRVETAAFAGNAACVSCHAEAGNVWKDSRHHHALKTLEDEGHGRDPDCVVCHVVGLDSTLGFRDRATTPDLTDVGCESCHGPGKAHSVAPLLEKMAKVGEKSCRPCHTPENSPNFDFATYWAKIKH